MAGIIVVDRIESDASYASSINIASPLVVANTISIGSNLAINSSGINAASIGFGTLPSNRIVFESNQSAVKTALNASGDAGIFAARAWVNFNGTGTVVIRGSGNVSTVADNGTGNYTVNFTTAMPDINYAVACTTSQQANINSTEVRALHVSGDVSMVTTNVRVMSKRTIAGGSIADIDGTFQFVAIFR